eukprot:CAMPEP_0174272158 /NCGR_PEP_ID=MMETSP0439-20130205/50380_1 /TAXON_ID=0 /ORGANISM="Stereomyxa ramosa, Strain Chinc5" /LENGTH=453 /DNA_ID=CAMNT_0015362597 /DNA_START=62 /DNA_END=1423 /DNA_ORIENTATION=+
MLVEQLVASIVFPYQNVTYITADLLFLPNYPHSVFFSTGCYSAFNSSLDLTDSDDRAFLNAYKDIFNFLYFMHFSWKNALLEGNQTLDDIPDEAVSRFLEHSFGVPLYSFALPNTTYDNTNSSICPFAGEGIQNNFFSQVKPSALIKDLFKPFHPLMYQTTFTAPFTAQYIGEWNWAETMEMGQIQAQNYWFPGDPRSVTIRFNEKQQLPIISVLDQKHVYINSDISIWNTVIQFYCPKNKLFVKRDETGEGEEEMEELEEFEKRAAKSGVDHIATGAQFVRCPPAVAYSLTSEVYTPPPVWDYLFSFFRYADGVANDVKLRVPGSHNCRIFFKGLNRIVSLPQNWCTPNPSIKISYFDEDNPLPIFQVHPLGKNESKSQTDQANSPGYKVDNYDPAPHIAEHHHNVVRDVLQGTPIFDHPNYHSNDDPIYDNIPHEPSLVSVMGSHYSGSLL